MTIFSSFDADNDGKLSKTEYITYLKAMGLWGKESYTDDNFDAGWVAECKRLKCRSEDGITWESFHTILYGSYRLFKIEADLCNAVRYTTLRPPPEPAEKTAALPSSTPTRRVDRELSESTATPVFPELEPEPEPELTSNSDHPSATDRFAFEVKDAGSVRFNGVYTEVGNNDGLPTYRKLADGSHRVGEEMVRWGDGRGGWYMCLQPLDGGPRRSPGDYYKVQSTADRPLASGWQVDLGKAPAPSLHYF
eukprot:COSAG02_NODE_3175_length_7227_cov_4.752104_3_plen_250_part_00